MSQTEYPLASFCIVAYQAENFISETIDAAFAQDYPNMEIVMSDDGSSDRTFEIMQEKAASYNGPHKIILNRNETNIGPRENYNKVLYELSNGEFIVLADGDDISRSDRTSVCVDLMMKHPDVMSMSVNSQRIDEKGVDLPMNDWEKLSIGKYSIYTLCDYVSFNFFMASGDSRVLRRTVIDSFPPLEYTYSEDVFLYVRSLYLGSVILLREPLVKYRQHSNSIMGKSRAHKYTRNDIKIFESRTVKQLNTDFKYAIEHNYIKPSEIQSVRWKIDELILWLKPKRRTFLWRVTHRLSKYSIRFFKRIMNQLQ